MLDPDRQVQDTIRFLFRTFQRTGSASATVRAFRADQVPFPRRVRSGPRLGELVWGDIRHDDVLRLLHNPCYAGAYVFGRTRTFRTVDGKVHVVTRPRDEWQVVIQDAHIGYLSWDDYEANLRQLTANSQAYAPARLAPPREGPALLQGLALCGICGERMTVRYHQRAGQRIVPDYICQRTGIAEGGPPCQRIPGRELDAAVGKVLLSVVTPEAVELTLAIQAELAAQTVEAERLRQLDVERAQYEADLAQRRYRRVDPENRLVAGVLEAEWNAKLVALAAAQQIAEDQRQAAQVRLSAQERQTMLDLTRDFPRFWQDRRTTARDRKRIARLLISDVTLCKGEVIEAHIRFKGGATRTLPVALPPPFAQSRLTPASTLALINQFLDDYTDAEIAAELNTRGECTYAGLPFTAAHVSQLRRKHGLKTRYDRLREAGLLTVEEAAAQWNVTVPTIWRWYQRGWIQGERYNDRGSCLFRPLRAVPPESRRRDAKRSTSS
ncbi:MAG: recombinase family protein [Chloroflexota bacterium]|nr:recombinase family protein [Chloroflexota bacterium]